MTRKNQSDGISDMKQIAKENVNKSDESEFAKDYIQLRDRLRLIKEELK